VEKSLSGTGLAGQIIHFKEAEWMMPIIIDTQNKELNTKDFMTRLFDYVFFMVYTFFSENGRTIPETKVMPNCVKARFGRWRDPPSNNGVP